MLMEDRVRDRTGFPVGNYTPFGYISNYYQKAKSWQEVWGGSLRTSKDYLGFGWVYPTERQALGEVSCGWGIKDGCELLLGRADWSQVGVCSHYHSANIFSYNSQPGGVLLDSRYFLAERNILVNYFTVENPGPETRHVTLYLLTSAWRDTGTVSVRADKRQVVVEEALEEGRHKLVWGSDGPLTVQSVRLARSWEEMKAEADTGKAGSLELTAGAVKAAIELDVVLAPGEARRFTVLLTRAGLNLSPAAARSGTWERTYRQRLAEDAEFYNGMPLLAGDWPQAWKNSWIYDFETTRMCTFPPGGVFRDYWPSWMISYPRVVIAEGSLDMMRLHWADPDRAQRAVLAMFRDTPGANVPCINEDGTFNMVASDGSTCGTSPAWCLPFYNIYLMYLRSLDKVWLEQLYPHMVEYVEWWLKHRTDEAGWMVYKCTWEAGEDNTPRIDPECTGDNVVSAIVRPVELQAAMAQSCYVLERFASELGREDEQCRWRQLRDDFTAKTRQLWDPGERRFRDWDKRTGQFLAYEGESDYWGTNPRRFSALSLTPLILGIATGQQVQAMAEEIRHYGRPPWTFWPSWSYVTEEAASWAGMAEFAAENAFRILDRVYRENDVWDLQEFKRGMPGVAREYWPEPLAEFRGSDGYAWGATTAVFLLRQILGFRESETTAGVEFILTPSLPRALREQRGRYGITNLGYRGISFNLWEAPADPAGEESIEVTLQFAVPRKLTVADSGGKVLYAAQPDKTHTFTVPLFTTVTVQVQ